MKERFIPDVEEFLSTQKLLTFGWNTHEIVVSSLDVYKLMRGHFNLWYLMRLQSGTQFG